MPLCHYIFFFSLGRQASRQKRTDWKNGSINIHFAQAGHFDEKFQIFFWPHVVPKWNPNIAWGSLSWFRSIRVRGLAVMGVWKCVNNSIYESPVTTQAKTKIDHKLEPMVRLQMTIRIIRRLTSLWLLTKIFWPKFFDRNVYWKLPPLSIVYFHIYWDYLVHFFSFKNSFPQNFLNVVRETNWQYHFIQHNWWSWQRRSVLSRFMPSESWYRPAIETWQKTIRVSSHPVIGNLSHPTCFQVFWKKYLAETLKMTPPHRSILI